MSLYLEQEVQLEGWARDVGRFSLLEAISFSHAVVLSLANVARECESERLLLHRGEERRLVDGVWCLPADELLRQLRPGRGLTAYLGSEARAQWP